MQLILPKAYVSDERLYSPVIFLAGPIAGGDNWRWKACSLLQRALIGVTLVDPCYSEAHPYYAYRPDSDNGVFYHQTDWERYYLERAAKRGCILFWLPCESKTAPRVDGHPYARDTYGEIGEWRARLAADPSVRMVIGAHPDFPGLKIISRNFRGALGRELTIYSTLEETVREAIRVCKR